MGKSDFRALLHGRSRFIVLSCTSFGVDPLLIRDFTNHARLDASLGTDVRLVRYRCDVLGRVPQLLGTFAYARIALSKFSSQWRQVLRQVALSLSALSIAVDNQPVLTNGTAPFPPISYHPHDDVSSFPPDLNAIMQEQMNVITAMGMDPSTATTTLDFSTSLQLPTSSIQPNPLNSHHSHLLHPSFTDPSLASPMRSSTFDVGPFEITASSHQTTVSTSSPQDQLSAMDVERFGELHFDSSPSASGSPAHSAVSPPTF
jgi:hypothetical protein